MERLARLARGLGVGGVASLVDMAALAVLVSVLHVPPVVANVPSLAAGALVQFLGCRNFVFEGGRGGRLSAQVTGFITVELLTLVLNATLFHALIVWAHLPYAPARLLGSFVVFVGFSWPAWARVFAQRTQA